MLRWSYLLIGFPLCYKLPGLNMLIQLAYLNTVGGLTLRQTHLKDQIVSCARLLAFDGTIVNRGYSLVSSWSQGLNFLTLDILEKWKVLLCEIGKYRLICLLRLLCQSSLLYWKDTGDAARLMLRVWSKDVSFTNVKKVRDPDRDVNSIVST